LPRPIGILACNDTRGQQLLNACRALGIRMRVRRVRELLDDSELSLGTIATMAGFQHAEYMSAVFRKHVGQCPRSFRKQSRGDQT